MNIGDVGLFLGWAFAGCIAMEIWDQFSAFRRGLKEKDDDTKEDSR